MSRAEATSWSAGVFATHVYTPWSLWLTFMMWKTPFSTKYLSVETWRRGIDLPKEKSFSAGIRSAVLFHQINKKNSTLNSQCRWGLSPYHLFPTGAQSHCWRTCRTPPGMRAGPWYLLGSAGPPGTLLFEWDLPKEGPSYLHFEARVRLNTILLND